jgi:transmembrane sensor
MDRALNLTSEREAAAAWHDRLHRDKVSEETRRNFAEWVTESPERQALYDSIDEVWTRLTAAADDPQILALRHETALRLTRRTWRRMRPLHQVAAAVLLAMLASAGILMLHSPSSSPLVASLVGYLRGEITGHYATATGERLVISLRDGSQVTLNTQSELNLDFTKSERVVRLARGQAFFEVAKDARRPFVVEARNRRFVAVGTAFDVRLDGSEVKVTMVEGTVRVERALQSVLAQHDSDNMSKRSSAPVQREMGPRDAVAAQPVTTITSGEELTAGPQPEDRIQTADPERSTSWRRGQVIFEDTRLADAIAELNRYSETQIELAEPGLGELRLSGAFATGRPTVFVNAITVYFPIRVLRSDEKFVVLTQK